MPLLPIADLLKEQRLMVRNDWIGGMYSRGENGLRESQEDPEGNREAHAEGNP